jgi:hypothetical protein
MQHAGAIAKREKRFFFLIFFRANPVPPTSCKIFGEKSMGQIGTRVVEPFHLVDDIQSPQPEKRVDYICIRALHAPFSLESQIQWPSSISLMLFSKL